MYENGLFLGGVFLTPQNGRFWGKSKNPKKCTVGVQILPFFGVMAILAKNGQNMATDRAGFGPPFSGDPLYCLVSGGPFAPDCAEGAQPNTDHYKTTSKS